MSTLLVLAAFAGSAAESSDDGGLPVFFRYDVAIGGIVVYAVLFVIAWAAAQLGYGNAPEALGLRRFPLRYIWIALGLMFAALIVSAALEPVFHAGEKQGLAPDEWISDRWPAFVFNAAVVVLVAPFVEEIFYRGLGVRVLGFLGGFVSIVGTSLVFALAHGILVAVPGARDLRRSALGWLRWRTESVWPGVIAHAAYNFLGVIGALLVLFD